MSNKDMILQNNKQLLLHKQDILDLPTAAEIAAEASTGLYVWKKCNYTPEESVSGLTFTATFPVITAEKDYCNIVAENYDTSRIDNFIDFYDGFHRTDSAYYLFEKTNDKLYYNQGGVGSEVTKAEPDKITFSGNMTRLVEQVYTFTCNSAKSLKSVIGEIAGYVVSDSPTSYPDGGVQDGFWYERIDKLQKGLNILARREDGSASKICLNYDGQTLNRNNGLGAGTGSSAICSAEEVEIIADELQDEAGTYGISFWSRGYPQKEKLKIKDSITLQSSSIVQYAKKLWVSNVTSISFPNGGTYKYGLGSNQTEAIYAEPSSQPSGWDSRWNYYGTNNFNTVVWGVSEEQFDAM